jgi:hypothetical protein
MPITPEQREMVANELKRFATDLSLSEDQKQKLHAFCRRPTTKCRNTSNRIPVSPRRI